MKLIIAGSRTIEDEDVVLEAFNNSPFEWNEVELIISGCADGVDQIGIDLAMEHSIPVHREPVSEYVDEAYSPKTAPLDRNRSMAEQADALLAVKTDESSGTENMIKEAERCGLLIHIRNIDQYNIFDFD